MPRCLFREIPKPTAYKKQELTQIGALRSASTEISLAIFQKAIAIRTLAPRGGNVTKRRRQTMKSILCLSLLILLMPSAYAAELPGDSADGSFLHDANCLGCHDTGTYTRKDRRIRSLDALKGQLASCSHMANLQFSAIEMQNIIKYLNDQFYQFP